MTETVGLDAAMKEGFFIKIIYRRFNIEMPIFKHYNRTSLAIQFRRNDHYKLDAGADLLPFSVDPVARKITGTRIGLRYRLLHEIPLTGLEINGTNMPDFPPIGVQVIQ